jgi:hypothetical protein
MSMGITTAVGAAKMSDQARSREALRERAGLADADGNFSSV